MDILVGDIVFERFMGVVDFLFECDVFYVMILLYSEMIIKYYWYEFRIW